MFSTDPEFLTLVFAGAAGLAVAYFAIYQVLVILRIRALGLVKGKQRITLSDGSSCDVEFKPRRGTGMWELTLRLTAMHSRLFRIPLPVPETSAFAKFDREILDFGRQAFEIGMDWIRQEDLTIEIGSKSFRPLKHGHAGFIDRLGKGLGKIGWKLASDESEQTLADLERPGDMGTRAFALFAALFALFMSWVEPVMSHGALVLDPFPAYAASLGLALALFLFRRVSLRRRYSHLRRKPPLLGECFWPAFAGGILVLIPIQHLNVKMDSSAPRLVTTQITKKVAIEGFSSASYMVHVKRTDGKGTWVVELSPEDYLAARTGGTLVNLKFHSGAFGMEWLERATLEEVDRNVASSPNDRAPTPPLGQ